MAHDVAIVKQETVVSEGGNIASNISGIRRPINSPAPRGHIPDIFKRRLVDAEDLVRVLSESLGT
jgi:hypothetical protein